MLEYLYISKSILIEAIMPHIYTQRRKAEQGYQNLCNNGYLQEREANEQGDGYLRELPPYLYFSL